MLTFDAAMLTLMLPVLAMFNFYWVCWCGSIRSNNLDERGHVKYQRVTRWCLSWVR